MTDQPTAPAMGVTLEPLTVTSVHETLVERDWILEFNRKPTELELDAMRHAPSQDQLIADLSRMAERCIIDELVIRLFRTLILGNVVLPETPAAMTWLKDYIDGVNHGPMGRPMVWPIKIPGVGALLTAWGFVATNSVPPYVTRAPMPKHEPEVTK